jgi:hypothetical protein
MVHISCDVLHAACHCVLYSDAVSSTVLRNKVVLARDDRMMTLRDMLQADVLVVLRAQNSYYAGNYHGIL